MTGQTGGCLSGRCVYRWRPHPGPQCWHPASRAVHKPAPPQAMVQVRLRRFPGALGFGTQGLARCGGCDQATASVLARTDRQPTLSHHGLQVAGQRRCIHLQAPRQIAGSDRPEFDDIREQGVLSALQAHRGQVVVVVAVHHPPQLSKLQIGAASRCHSFLHVADCTYNTCICNSSVSAMTPNRPSRTGRKPTAPCATA